MILNETNAERLLRLRHIPDYPQTVEQAAKCGQRWPGGLRHRGESPKTLREMLSE